MSGRGSGSARAGDGNGCEGTGGVGTANGGVSSTDGGAGSAGAGAGSVGGDAGRAAARGAGSAGAGGGPGSAGAGGAGCAAGVPAWANAGSEQRVSRAITRGVSNGLSRFGSLRPRRNARPLPRRFPFRPLSQTPYQRCSPLCSGSRRRSPTPNTQLTPHDLASGASPDALRVSRQRLRARAGALPTVGPRQRRPPPRRPRPPPWPPTDTVVRERLPGPGAGRPSTKSGGCDRVRGRA
jgi:hypothetical protein